MRRFTIISIGLFIAIPLLFAADQYENARAKMLDLLIKREIKDTRVLDAMQSVQRHLFVPENMRRFAYSDQALPIGEGQTISQPYAVAYMTQELHLQGTDKVLEIGTGSGYQAAILAEIVDSVFTIEIKNKLAERSTQLLRELGYKNIQTRYADGYFGWSEHAPFDAIIITCAINHIPFPLLEQLKTGGRLILPLGSTRYYQILTRLTKKEDMVEAEYLSTVAFVPMTGRAR